MSPITSFDSFAEEYDRQMGDSGDYTHQNTIDPAFFEALGEVKGKTIYDLGCGNGYIARKLVKMGASKVLASDISPKLIEIAKNKYPLIGIEYLVRDGADFSRIPENNFDLVVINMAIHYIENLDNLFKNISKILKVNGRLVYTTDHPFRLLAHIDLKQPQTFEEVVEDGRKYLSQTFRDVPSFWDRKIMTRIYNRPLGMQINLLVKNGFVIDSLIEPPTKKLKSSEDSTPVYSPIPFKLALGARKV